MFTEDVNTLSKSAAAKNALLQNRPAAYWVSSMLGGLYVGLGVLITQALASVAAQSNSTLAGKALGSAAFSMALSLVVFAGAELFTGNVMTGSFGWLKKSISGFSTIKFCTVCFLGNWAGAILLALVFAGTGFMAEGTALRETLATATAAKMAIEPLALVMRGVFANLFVCLGVWCATRCKAESAKLIMIFFCIFAFVFLGFEHCIANMTLLTLGLFAADAAAEISLGGYFYNILLSCLGNIIGGALFVALPYAFIGKQRHTKGDNP